MVIVMKLFLAALLASFLFGTPAFSQTGSDTVAAKTEQRKERSKQAVDEDANGVDDKLEANERQRTRDRFVDEDGDGICDGRERGLGFRGGRGSQDGTKGTSGRYRGLRGRR